MAQLVNEDARIKPFQPVLHLLEKLQSRFFREIPFVLREGNGDFQLLCQRQIDREDGTKLFPLFLAGGFWPYWSGVERGSSFDHGCITQSHNPCVNLTATAFRPSWYCTATTVASAAAPARESRCTRTWSAAEPGKKRASCPAHPTSSSTTAISVERFTQPLVS